MTQLHGIHRGLDTLRPTNDVDIVLHVETTRGIAARTATALESLGYQLAPTTAARGGTAHRFRRGPATVDLVTGSHDVVDVLLADHAAPRVIEKLRGRRMVAIDGGTQALRRTINARLDILPDTTTTVSVPSAFGAPSPPGRGAAARGARRPPIPNARTSPAPTGHGCGPSSARYLTTPTSGACCRPNGVLPVKPHCGSSRPELSSETGMSSRSGSGCFDSIGAGHAVVCCLVVLIGNAACRSFL